MKFEIEHSEPYYDCECCGSYSNTHIRVIRDGVEVAKLYHGGHFGGGDFDDHSVPSALAALLRQLFPGSEIVSRDL